MQTIELGHFALILAFAIGIAQVAYALTCWRAPQIGNVLFMRHASILQFVLTLASFTVLSDRVREF